MSTETQPQVQIERPVEPKHPIRPELTHEQACAIVAQHGLEALAEAQRRRNAAIRAEKSDPLNHGFELPTWLLADVLLGFIGYDVFVKRIERMIPVYDFRPRVQILLQEWVRDPALKAAIDAGPYQLGLLLGGNAAGKTRYMMKRGTADAVRFDKSRIWMLHESEAMSITYHQALVWEYLPETWQNAGMRGRPAYVSHKSATGFSKPPIGPNGSEIVFKNYQQDEDAAIEGGEVGDPLQRRCCGFLADELLPEPWLRTLEKRLNRRQAVGIVGFTPKHGYNDTCARFLAGARLIRAEMGMDLNEPKLIPLVRVSGDNRVIINFHTHYNPYPNRESYPNLVANMNMDSDTERAIRVYGHAEEDMVTLFGRLNVSQHMFKSRIFMAE